MRSLSLAALLALVTALTILVISKSTSVLLRLIIFIVHLALIANKKYLLIVAMLLSRYNNFTMTLHYNLTNNFLQYVKTSPLD